MTTVDAIAAKAFTAVAAKITDAVHDGTLSDGVTNYTGRVVFGGDAAPKGFPMAKPESRVRPAYFEGFGVVPESGWTIAAAGDTHYITSRRDVVEAGGLTVANVIASGDLLWMTADIEAKTSTPNGAGGFTEAWAAITGGSGVSIGLWALSGQERWASDRREAVSSWRAVMPYLAGVDETCRIVADGREYNVTFADNCQKRGAWLVLDLGEGVAV